MIMKMAGNCRRWLTLQGGMMSEQRNGCFTSKLCATICGVGLESGPIWQGTTLKLASHPGVDCDIH